MARPALARVALTGVVVLLLVMAQVQIWSEPPAYDAGGRALNAVLAVAMTLPILLATRPGTPMAAAGVCLAKFSSATARTTDEPGASISRSMPGDSR